MIHFILFLMLVKVDGITIRLLQLIDWLNDYGQMVFFGGFAVSFLLELGGDLSVMGNQLIGPVRSDQPDDAVVSLALAVHIHGRVQQLRRQVELFGFPITPFILQQFPFALEKSVSLFLRQAFLGRFEGTTPIACIVFTIISQNFPFFRSKNVNFHVFSLSFTFLEQICPHVWFSGLNDYIIQLTGEKR